MSFRPASRLMSDSVRSPIVPTNAIEMPAMIHHQEHPVTSRPTAPTPTAVSAEPQNPPTTFEREKAQVPSGAYRTEHRQPSPRIVGDHHQLETNEHPRLRHAASISTTNEARTVHAAVNVVETTSNRFLTPIQQTPRSTRTP